GFAQTMRARIERLDARCHEISWHLDFLAPGWLTEELMPAFAKMRSHYSVAHMGMFRAEAGPTQPGFRKLLDTLRDSDGRAFVKLTGVYRMATPPAYADAAAMARALIEAAPDRLIWAVTTHICRLPTRSARCSCSICS